MPPPASPPSHATAATPLGGVIAAGLLSWMVIAFGFLGLHMLMQERPQFIGEPTHTSRTELVQDSPRIVLRKLSDDISVIKPAQPESSEITFEMRGRRDHRGLRTVIDMSGEVRAHYVLTNVFEEPVFVLFKCPHPRAETSPGQSLQAGGLKLQVSQPGIQENAKDAWLWSGTVEPRATITFDLSYQAASLKALTYRLGAHPEPVKHLRVAFRRHDLAAMRFESGDGPVPAAGDELLWERKDFLAPEAFSAAIVESRNLHGSLLQLLEIGPLICLLFLLAVSAIILARQPLTALQMLTIAAGYAFYFPLIVYLSSRFSFALALVIALVVPGALLVNYARLLLGAKLGLAGGVAFLLLYQVFPTLAAFVGWNRGMVLLCLGVVTFAVLINLQNQALRKKAVTLLLALAGGTLTAQSTDVQVIVPGKLVEASLGSAAAAPLLSFGVAEYTIRQEAAYFQVDAVLPFQVLRMGDVPVPLFTQPAHLQTREIEASALEVAQLVTVGNRLALLAQSPGSGRLRCTYRVGIATHEGRQRAQIPLLAGPSGKVRLESTRTDLENAGGTLWTKTAQDKLTVYEFGVAGEEVLGIEWRGDDSGAARVPAAAQEFYGIGITRAQHLTVINSDGSCSHFAEFDLPATTDGELRLRLPPKARLLSVSLDGVEITAPALEDQTCRIRLPARESGKTAHRLSFRLAYPPVRLGFLGTVDLALPEVFQTVGTLEWIAVLPGGFDAQVISSGLEVQKSAPDLARFGDYGRILKTHSQTSLAKDLAPPGPVTLSLRYRQAIPALDGL